MNDVPEPKAASISPHPSSEAGSEVGQGDKRQNTKLEQAEEGKVGVPKVETFSDVVFNEQDILMIYNMAKVSMKSPGNFNPSWKYAAAYRRVREALRRIKLLPS